MSCFGSTTEPGKSLLFRCSRQCRAVREEGRKQGAVAGNSKARRGNFGNRVTVAIWTSGACNFRFVQAIKIHSAAKNAGTMMNVGCRFWTNLCLPPGDRKLFVLAVVANLVLKYLFT